MRTDGFVGGQSEDAGAVRETAHDAVARGFGDGSAEGVVACVCCCFFDEHVDAVEELIDVVLDAADDDGERAGTGAGDVDRFDGGGFGFAALAGPVEQAAGAAGVEGFALPGVGVPVEDFGGEGERIEAVAEAGCGREDFVSIARLPGGCCGCCWGSLFDSCRHTSPAVAAENEAKVAESHRRSTFSSAAGGGHGGFGGGVRERNGLLRGGIVGLRTIRGEFVW